MKKTQVVKIPKAEFDLAVSQIIGAPISANDVDRFVDYFQVSYEPGKKPE